jgi:hypothetical protein
MKVFYVVFALIMSVTLAQASVVDVQRPDRERG